MTRHFPLLLLGAVVWPAETRCQALLALSEAHAISIPSIEARWMSSVLIGPPPSLESPPDGKPIHSRLYSFVVQIGAGVTWVDTRAGEPSLLVSLRAGVMRRIGDNARVGAEYLILGHPLSQGAVVRWEPANALGVETGMLYLGERRAVTEVIAVDLAIGFICDLFCGARR